MLSSPLRVPGSAARTLPCYASARRAGRLGWRRRRSVLRAGGAHRRAQLLLPVEPPWRVGLLSELAKRRLGAGQQLWFRIAVGSDQSRYVRRSMLPPLWQPPPEGVGTPASLTTACCCGRGP